MTPADIALGVFHCLLLGLALAQFEFIQTRLEHLPGFVAVAVLGAVVLTLHDNAGRLVRQTHGGVGLVDVLTTRAGGTVGVGTHVGRVDVDLDRVIHFRIDHHRAEAGMATGVGVERRFAHEAVNARLRAQEAVGVLARHLDSRALDAGHFALGFFEQFGREALALAVAQVHALEHAGPVLRLGTTGACLDLDEAGVFVHGVGEHAAEFEFANQFLQLGHVALDRLEGVVVVFGLGHLEQFEQIVRLLLDFIQRQHDAFEHFLFLAQILGALRVVPDLRVF